MNFCTYLEDGQRLSLLCFDTPPFFQKEVARSVQCGPGIVGIDAFCQLHHLVIAQVLKPYETSVWGMRNHIRTVEKVSEFDHNK